MVRRLEELGVLDTLEQESEIGAAGARPKLLALTGPTGTGKSALAMEIADHIPLEIISADSMQVYRHMDIGTAKPTKEEQAKVPHHLIDVKNPDETWSARDFVVGAQRAIDTILGRGAVPCIVGGTGLYVRALLQGFPLGLGPPDQQFRDEMRAMADAHGNEAVHDLLKDKDPAAWERLHPNDHKRVVRALEYYRATGKPITDRVNPELGKYDATVIGIDWDRVQLAARIDSRVEEQFRHGFVDEVQGLREMGYSREHGSMQGLGYKEIGLLLDGKSTLHETIAAIKQNTRRFSKRQRTWFAREKGIIWVSAGQDISWSATVAQALELCLWHLDR